MPRLEGQRSGVCYAKTGAWRKTSVSGRYFALEPEAVLTEALFRNRTGSCQDGKLLEVWVLTRLHSWEPLFRYPSILQQEAGPSSGARKGSRKRGLPLKAPAKKVLEPAAKRAKGGKAPKRAQQVRSNSSAERRLEGRGW